MYINKALERAAQLQLIRLRNELYHYSNGTYTDVTSYVTECDNHKPANQLLITSKPVIKIVYT